MTPPPVGSASLAGLAPPVARAAAGDDGSGSEVGLHAPAGPPAPPVLSSATVEVAVPPTSARSDHLTAGTVPPADLPDPDHHVIHRDLPDSAPPAPTSLPEPAFVHPTSIFPVRSDVEPAPTLDPAPHTLPTDTLGPTDPTLSDTVSGALASASGFVDATEAALDSAVAQATAPDPDDADPALAPFRLSDPQDALPVAAAVPTRAGLSFDDTHPTGAAAALKNVSDQLARVEADKMHAPAATGGMHDEREERELVPGMGNDKLFAMMRRFDIQVKHVLSPPTNLPPGEPDLRRTALPSVPFDVDSLRSNAERLYATAGVWDIYSYRELSRLVDWSDRRRTAGFAGCYFVAWGFGMVLPLLLTVVAVLMAYEPAREWLFPPVRPHGLGPLSSQPTKAEQVEQHAAEFTNLLQQFAAACARSGVPGKGKEGNAKVGRKQHAPSSDSESEDQDEFGLVNLVVEGAEMGLDEREREMRLDGVGKRERKKAVAAERKRAKAKRDALVGRVAKMTQDGLGDSADWLEVLANAFSPPRPYPKTHAREKVAGLVVIPLALVLAVVPIHVWSQLFSFAVGVGLFGQPMLFSLARQAAARWPEWPTVMDPRNSLFSRVPTNAQLVLHCLRVKEAQLEPLPPPPPAPEPDAVKDRANDHNARSNAADPDFDDPSADPLTAQTQGQAQGDRERERDGSKGKGRKGVMHSLRSAVRKAAPFRSDLTAKDALATAAGKVDHAVYQSKAEDDGRVDSYPAKLDGTSGHLVLERRAGREAHLAFVPVSSGADVRTLRASVEDLVECKKSAVSSGRTVLGLVGGLPLDGAGLEVRFKPRRLREADGLGKGVGEEKEEETFEGEVHVFEHVGRRNQLFARLVSMGGQKFDSL